MRKFAFLSLFLVLSVIIFAQEPGENHSRIRAAVAERNYLTAIAEMQNLELKYLSSFKLNNYDYLLARMSEKSGDYATAMASYQRVSSRNSLLKEYALWHLSQIARSTGNLMLERIYLQELIAFSPGSLLQIAAGTRMARSWFESENYNESIRLLSLGQISGLKTGGGSKTTDSPLARENLVLLAQSYLYSGKTVQARETFTKLTNNLPNPAQPDDFALEGVKGLDLLDGGSNKTVPNLADFEHLRRALIYQFNRDFVGARLHYKAIIDNYPASGSVPDAVYSIGRGYAQAGEFVEAVGWFERAQEQFPDHPAAKDALLQAASAYLRLGKYKEAIARYQKFIEKYPDDERLDRAYLNIVDVLRDQGEETEALKWTTKTQEVFKGKLPEAIALFAQARIFIARSDWPNALNDLERLRTLANLGGASVPGGTNSAEINFLRAYTLEQMGRYTEAIEVYLSIPDGWNEYYGGRATERLGLLANDERAKPIIVEKAASLMANLQTKDADTQRKNAQAALRLIDSPDARERMVSILKKAYANLPAYRRGPGFKLLDIGRKEIIKDKRETRLNSHQALADELIFLGLYDEAAPELEASRQIAGDKTAGAASIKKPTDFDYTLAVFYNRGGIANPTLLSVWDPPGDYQIELIPRDVIEMHYPTPYADSLLRYAPPREVDPRFVLSIMRQESRYRADVKSYAAARGMMQFISTTADKIAGELGRENFRQDELYNPPTAIHFGSHYLGNIFKQFPGQPAAVAASYNGGDDNMKRWMNRSKSNLPDRYVPEIVYSQTKDYVYKVMANYRVYQMLYDENLKAK